LIYYTSYDGQKRANAAYLIGCYMVRREGREGRKELGGRNEAVIGGVKIK
jgi:hypothetical protein